MTTQATDEELLLMIKGCQVPYGGLGEPLTRFSGNQWNEDSAWNEAGLRTLSREERIKLLDSLLENRKS